MRMLRYAIAVLALCLLPVSAQAATCFWVAGTSYNNAASWSSSSGGAGSTCAATSGIPKNAGDVATLDTGSPAATILLLDVDISIATLDMRTLTGSSGFDATTHNITLTTQFFVTGTGTRSLSMGSGTWTLGSTSTSVFVNFLTTTGLTFNKNTSNIVMPIGSATIGNLFFGGLSFGPLTITGSATFPATVISFEAGAGGNDTFASLTVNAPAYIKFRFGNTFTFTSGITVNGSSWSAPVTFDSDNSSGTSSQTTIAVGSASSFGFAVLRNLIGATSTITVNPAVNLGSVTGTFSLTSPGTGGSGGGFIIGGG